MGAISGQQIVAVLTCPRLNPESLYGIIRMCFPGVHTMHIGSLIPENPIVFLVRHTEVPTA